MAKNGERHRFQIVSGDVIPVIQDSADFGSENQRLQAARTGSVADVFLCGSGCEFMIRMSRHDQGNPVTSHVVGNRDHARQLRHLQNSFAAQYGFGFRL